MDKIFQKILLAFDDSKASRIALQKACEFATTFNSEITALFVSSDSSGSFEDSKKYLEDFATSKKIELEIIEKQGKVYSEVIKLEKEGDYSLIVLGAHGQSGWKPFWTGSNTFKVISSSNCPVISVLEKSADVGLGNIVLPLGNSNSTRQKVPYCAQIAKAFNSTIHIIGVSKGVSTSARSNVNSYIRQTERYLAERGIKYTVSTDFGVTVAERILEYSEEVKAGLMVIMTETERTGLFMDSYSQQLVNQSPVAVMCIHSRDTRLASQAGY